MFPHMDEQAPQAHSGLFLEGQFDPMHEGDGELTIVCPGDITRTVSRTRFALSSVDKAVEAARQAFRIWRHSPLDGRIAFLKSYQEGISNLRQSIAQAIALEMGKTLWEADAEVTAMVRKVDITIKDLGVHLSAQTMAHLPGEIRFRPLGVLAVVGPFNFPGHLPNGQIVPALLSGNAVIFKPSEKTPLAGTLMAQAIASALEAHADVPKGVFALVQGDGKVAEKLTTHPGIDGILFTGSREVGQLITQANAHRPERLIALELGGKNISVIDKHADINSAVRETVFAAFATTGQRCTSTSRLCVHREIADRFLTQFIASAKSIRVGFPTEVDVFMGPMVSEAARRKWLDGIESAQALGAERLLNGGVFEAEQLGWYARPTVHLVQDMTAEMKQRYLDHELFGPDVAVQLFEGIDEAIYISNDSRFGLSSAIFTENFEHAEAFIDNVETGVVHWNRSTAGANSELPFGGIKHSGNHRPAGAWMTQQCVYPQSVLKPATQKTYPSWPGIQFSSSADPK